MGCITLFNVSTRMFLKPTLRKWGVPATCAVDQLQQQELVAAVGGDDSGNG